MIEIEQVFFIYQPHVATNMWESSIVDFHAMIPGEKIEKNKKKTHRFNVVRQIAHVYENSEEDFHYMSN